MLQLRRAKSGRALFDGENLAAMQGEALRKGAEIPKLREVAPGQFAACHHPLA